MEDQQVFEQISAMGFKVHKFTPFHYRLADRIDVFPNIRSTLWRFHDTSTGRRGSINHHELAKFLPKFMEQNPVAQTKRLTVVSNERGWWNCQIEGCKFKMRDDGTAASARRMSEHLDSH
jgi:hypothetical protein